MALGMRKPAVYELRCPSCKTSAPPEMRRCIHCGGPLSATDGPLPTSDGPQRLRDLLGDDAQVFERTEDDTALIAEPIESSESGREAEEARPRRGARSLGLLWLLMALAASLYRACAGPS